MKNEITALEIEIRHKRHGEDFQFNDTMIHAVLSGLSIVFEEVFLWSLKNHLAIWAVNGNPEFLTRTFIHHRGHFKKMKIETGLAAEDLLTNIVDGKIWKSHTPMAKFESLQHSYQLATEEEYMGEILTPLFAKSLHKLAANPIITGAENSWQKNSDDTGEKFASIVATIQSPNLFYRFCIN